MRALAALAVGGTGLAVATWLPARADVASAADRADVTVFADEFDGGQGSRPDPSRWAFYVGSSGGAHDGESHLRVTGPLSSRVTFAQPYGHAEASLQAAQGAPAWWAFGVVNTYGRWLPGRLEQVGADPLPGPGFHTHTIDWSPTEILLSVDGEPFLRLDRNQPGEPLALVVNPMRFDRSRPVLLVDFVRVATSSDPGPSPTPTESTLPDGSPTATPTESSPAESSPTESSPTDIDPTATPTGSGSPTSPTAAPTSTPSPDLSTSTPTAAPTTPTSTPSAAKPTVWKQFTAYAPGDLVKYKGGTYRVLEAHTALPGWEPTNVPSLFEKV